MPAQQCLEGRPLARDGGGDQLAIGINGRGFAGDETLR
jgi:hypothetical protein